MGCHALLQGIFPTQGSNLCLLCFQRTLAGKFLITGATWEAQTNTQIKINIKRKKIDSASYSKSLWTPLLLLSLTMASSGLQILEIILTLLGWVNVVVSCTQPLWKVNVFISNGIVVVQVVWEGLWMFCVDAVRGVQLAAGAAPGPAGYPNPLHHFSTCGPARPAGLPLGNKVRIPRLVWCSSSRSSLSSQQS